MTQKRRFGISRQIKGGARHGLLSGYWGQFHYENADWEAGQYFQDPPIAFPGESRTIKLSFMSPESHLRRLAVGSVFLLREGQRVIGYGRVTDILDLELRAEERLALLEALTRPD